MRSAGGLESAVMQVLYQTVVVQVELIPKVQLWIYWRISVPVLSCGPGLWVLAGGMRWIQVDEIGFLGRGGDC